MPQPPTHQDLVKRIQTLENECAQLRQMVRQLADSENKFRAFFDNSLDGLFITRPDGAVLEANPAACEMFGYSLEEILRLGRAAVADLDDPRLAAALQQRAQTGYFAGEVNFKRKDGTIVPVEITSATFHTREGEERASIIVRDITERKQAQARLRQKKKLNQLLLDSIPCVAILLRPGTREIVAMNKAAEEAGCQHEKTCYETWPKFETPCPWCLAPEVWRDGNAHHHEFEALGVAWEAHWVPVSDDLYLHYAFDITERKRAEESLRENEAFTRAVLDNLPIGLAVNTVDPEVRFVYMNDDFPRFYRTTRKDLLDPNDFWEVVYEDPNFREEIRSRVLADCASGDPGRMHWENIPIVRQGQETRYVCATNTPVLGGSLMISTVWDVTDRFKSEEQYRNLFESIDEGFCVVQVMFNADGHPVDYRFLETNPAFERQTGLHGAKGRSMRSLAPDHEAHWFETYGRIAMTGVPERFQNRANALGRWFDVYAFRIEAPEDRKVAILFNDITERKRAEEEREILQGQLLQAQKLESVGRLAGGVAHDYNNMLSVISGYTELALERVVSESELHADLKEVQAAARRSIEITRQLLAFARKQTINPQVVDLNELLENMLKMLRRLIGENIDLAWRPGKQLWAVKLDPAQADQILANLCVNARDAIDGVGKVTIETGNVVCDDAWCRSHASGRSGQFVMLAVSDDGCGMGQETLDQIFEPFFTTKGVAEGTGLGLATVYGIVQQNEGFINVRSEPGQGATFEIYLPRHAADQASVKLETRAQPPVSRGETVLVVEDEPAIMKLAKVMLQRLGYRVLAADSPNHALQLADAHAHGIDLLMTDVVMPEMNGHDLADQLHRLHPNLKILYMSGYTADVIAHHGVLEKGMHFIQKPFSLSELGAKAREALDGGQ